VTLESHVPSGPLEEKWDKHKFDIKLVNPANKRRFEIIVVGTGLAGGAAAATLGELAAQGGINAAKNYPNDGDSIYRLFYDTMKGGDYRSREANVYRLAQVSVDIIDQCVAQGVPFAREYGGLLDNRSFGGAQVSRTFYARGQTGQQLLLGAYQALMRQVHAGTVTLYPRVEMLDLVVKDGRTAGIVCRDLETGEVFSMSGHAVVLASGGYGNAFYLSTNAKNSNVTAAWRASKRGAYFANPCYTQIHRSSRSCRSRRPPTAGSGCRRRWTTRARPTRFPRPTATISSSAGTRRSATWSPATSRPARSSARSMPAAASVRSRTGRTSTSRMPSTVSAKR
jgi:succinate dehydrogenase / fumarate reductase flavoprotein subunit